MNIRKTFAKFLHNKLQAKFKDKEPDFVVGSLTTGIYLQRWWIIPRNPFFNIYYHNFNRSDVDLALHDHSYVNMSFLLNSEYIEHTEKGSYHRKVGDIKMRLPKTLHRIELFGYDDFFVFPHVRRNKECWSLLITGPRVREWGFQDGPIVRNWLGFKTKANWLDHESFIEKYKDKLNYKGNMP